MAFTVLLSNEGIHGVEKRVISRNGHVYQAFPDIAKTPNGVLVCIYRECMGHGPYPFSRIAIRRSLDNGKSVADQRGVYILKPKP